MGVDGEGIQPRRPNTPQPYMLLRAGPYELYTGHRLTTFDCLDFLCNAPPDPLLVGFSFGYDASQILRDLPPERLAHLFADKPIGEGRSRYTYFGGFGIEYLPKNYLRVCRLRRSRVQMPDGRWQTHVTRVPDSARTVYETFGFFQMSFLKALQAFGIGSAHWRMIERNKEGRADFRRITREIRQYNSLECDLLADLMERFREQCYAVTLRPRTWNGAGKLAAAEHTSHRTITAAELAGLIPPDLERLASSAYYGGRFEVTRTGDVPGPVWEYDIGSAYPSAMRSLPCLLHGRWQQFVGKPPPRSLHLAYVSFTHPKTASLCGLPIRQDDGRLFWPREGQGVYWSTELNAARKLGARIRVTAGWSYERRCDCKPFTWIEGRYRQRQALGKNERGYPIKLALNSLYGKLAQRIGNPRWANLIWAGLITAHTRAQLMLAASQAPASVVMFATDALFSQTPLSLPLGEGLGQWEASEHPQLHIVQPGLYWGAKRPKTRGIPQSIFTHHTKRFENDWRVWCASLRDQTGPPIVGLELPTFTGLRLAHARGKPETACVWTSGEAAWREYSYDWTRKRDPVPVWETPTCARTMPAAGAPDLVSVAHADNQAWSTLDEERQRFDDQPDHVDMSPPSR